MTRVNIETTIPSFLAARPSRDVVVAGKQETTRLGWELRAPRFELFVSPFVWDEADLELCTHRQRANTAVTAGGRGIGGVRIAHDLHTRRIDGGPQ
jgi:hypothetical protein